MILFWLLGILFSLLVLGVFFEQCCRWKLEITAFKGRTFVEIKGKRLHYVKKGAGKCTVVFQSGMGSSHYIWNEIQEDLAQHAATISYDRNGIMFSEASGIPISNEQASNELELLLEMTDCPKPYLLVGHSMASIYLRPFIQRNEQDILGIVFVEAAHPLLKKKASSALLKLWKVPPRWFIHLAVQTGVYRILFSFIPLSSEIPLRHPLHTLEKSFFYKTYRKLIEELALDEQNFQDVASYTSFGSIPLTVVMGTSEKRYTLIKNPVIGNELRLLVHDLQHALLSLSANSRLVKAEHSGHIVQINDVTLLTNEIRKRLSSHQINGKSTFR